MTTNYALDVQGLPEVIYTSEGSAYLHLPGVIVTEKNGEVRYLLSDGLGSVRQGVDESAEVVAYQEFDPYGNPILNSSFLISNYGFTGEWWQEEIGLLHLRARWYAPETGTFLSGDAVESEPAYAYVRGNVVNLVDPSGNKPPWWCPLAFLECQYVGLGIRYGVEVAAQFGDNPDLEIAIRHNIGAQIIENVGPTIEQLASVYRVNPVIAKAIVWHEGAARERRWFTLELGAKPGFAANTAEFIQHYMFKTFGDDATVGITQLHVKGVQDFDCQGLVPRRSELEHLKSLLNEQQAVTYLLASLYSRSRMIEAEYHELGNPENSELLDRLTFTSYFNMETLLTHLRTRAQTAKDDGDDKLELFNEYVKGHNYHNQGLEGYLNWSGETLTPK